MREVSDDAIEDEKLSPLFTARVAVPDARLRIDDKMLPLSPGMLASVEIKTGSRTVMEYVLSSIMKAADEAGRERRWSATAFGCMGVTRPIGASYR